MALPSEETSEQVLRPLFDGVVDPDAVAARCNDEVTWDDMAKQEPLIGPDAVREHLKSKFPEGATLKIDRISDGVRSGGFTWHREVDGLVGLRGTLFAELDSDGRIVYVREGCEPLFKPGEATEKLLKAITSNIQKPERNPTYTPKQPRTACEVVKYLWEEAYPGGASPDVALGLFADDIVYEDFNYPTPFVGLAEVTDFVNAFDIPGIEFVPMRISEGKRGCAFTWKVKVNGQEGPSGISFYEVNDKGQVIYIRDIPAPSMPFGLPPPLSTLAALLRPKLRTFQARL